MIELLQTAEGRRSVLIGLFAAASAPIARAARAAPSPDAGPPDVAIFCDPTLAPAMRVAGDLFQARAKAPVAVFSAPPPLMLAQIEHGAYCDVLLTANHAVDDATRRGLVRPPKRSGRWGNRLVLAARAGEVASVAALSQDWFARTLGGGPIALTDPTTAATMDGREVLNRYGLGFAATGKVMGAASTADIAFLVKTGAAKLGLLYLTDIRADPALAIAAALDDAVFPIAYAAGINMMSKSPNAEALVDFLASGEAKAALAASGLETMA